MKTCPKCGSSVCDRYKCRICNTILLDVKNNESKNEHIVLNIFYIKYLVKSTWISGLCLILSALMAIFSPSFNMYSVSAIGLCVISVLICLFEHKFLAFFRRKYNRDYAIFQINIARYLSAALGLICSLVQILMAIITTK